MNILRYKQQALGHTLRDSWGGDSSSSGDSTGGSFGGGTFSFSSPSDAAAQAASAVAGYQSIGASTPTNTSGITVTGSGGGWNSPQAQLAQMGAGMLGGPLLGLAARGIAGYAGGNYTVGPDSSGGYGSTMGGGVSDFFGGGNLGNAITIAGGINSLTNAGGNIDTGVQRAGDPFAGYRGNLAAMYAGALSQGGQVDPTQMPGYSQWKSGVMDPAMEASKRSAAASGMLHSGNEQIALQKTAQQGYYGFMTDYMNRLAQGSGAVNNPATAASLGAQQGNMNQQATMQGIGAIGQGLAGYFSSGAATPVDMTGFYTPSSGVPTWVGSAAESAPPMTSVLGSDWGANAYDQLFTF